MNRAWAVAALALLAAWGAGAEERGMLSAVDFTAVRLEDQFWKPRLDVLRHKTLPHVFEWCERTNRIRNFEVAAGQVAGQHEGYYFNDSDVYKAVEGAAYVLALYPDAEWQKRIERLIATLAAAQQPDGYLNTYFQVAKPGERWTDDRFHELYCAGHLMEAGLAFFQTTGQRTLLDVAARYADHIASVFGPSARLEAPEHPEVELALIKLWRQTHAPRYLDLAKFFVEQRGQARGRPAWGEYAQDHRPVRAQTEVVGHAVRAMYLYSALTDLAAITGDPEYVTVLDQLWQDLVSRKMYITGGIGVSEQNEGFTAGYDLPNEKSYAETCASIGLAVWSTRMNRLHRDARYADVFERVVYNGALSGVALAGDQFLYANPLASRGADAAKHGSGAEGESASHRKPWFKCACCPPNVLRFFPTIGGYVYAVENDALYVNLYVASRAEVALQSTKVTLTQKTAYPWEGRVELRVDPEPSGALSLLLRIPGWCDGARLSLNGEALRDVERTKGYARISRSWKAGDVVALELPMPVVRVECDPRVRDNVGRVALQRGPLVYCLEQADNPGGVLNLAVPSDAALVAEQRPDLLGGVTVIRGSAWRLNAAAWGHQLYRPAPMPQRAEFTAIPYYAWDNRAPGEMTVWVPETPSLTQMPAPPE